MKKLGILLLALLLYLLGFSQKKTTPALPNVNKLMKMSPAELEAYKKKMIQQASLQAESLSKQYNLYLNPALIPGKEIKAPVLDTRRLSMIPMKPPTRAEILNSVQQSMQQVSKGIPAPRIEEIKKITSQDIKVESIHEAALGCFYNNNPKEGMYLMMLAVKQAPDSLEMVNNLAAMFNMHSIEQKAIPLLQYLLQKAPNNSIALNNIGQAYLGLGELFKAAEYLDICLSLDSLNIEANHSRGMLHMFKKRI